jgi:hypothetical protein
MTLRLGTHAADALLEQVRDQSSGGGVTHFGRSDDGSGELVMSSSVSCLASRDECPA